MTVRASSIAVLGGIAILIIVVVAYFRGWLVPFGSYSSACSKDEQILRPQLAAIKIHEILPKGAQDGERFSGCDSEDDYIYSGTSYSYPKEGATVIRFYDVEGERNGWTRVISATSHVSSDGKSGSACYRKPLENKKLAFLSVVFDNREVTATVSLSRESDIPYDGGVMC